MSALTGTRPLLKVALKQDIRNIVPWIGLISGLSASSILAYAWIFPDAEDRAALAATLGGNPALSLIFGPARDLMTADGFNAWRAGQLGAFFAGLMAILIVIRNSRADEDSGQAELIASGVIARGSRLAVALLMAGVASLALGIVCFVLTIACGGGIESTAILAATFAASGLMFAGLAAVTAQLGSDAQTASSIAIAVLGIAYVLRGYIDSSSAPDWATWLTPFGWLERTLPGSGNNPWPLLVAIAFTAVLVFGAFVLQSRRDFGQGLIATSPGPAEGGIVTSIWGLAFRLNRGSLITWLVAFAGLGLLFGNLATSIGDVMADNPAATAFLAAGGGGGNVTSAFVATILQIVAIIAAVMGVQVVMGMYTEEINYRAEPLLAAALRRSTYLASNALVALAGPAIAMVVAGAALGLVASAQDDSLSFADIVQQAIATIPAVWVLIALAVAVVGGAPSRRAIAWIGVVGTFGLTILGPTFNLPGWALDVSPLRHVPNVAAPSWEWTGLLGLAGVFLLLMAIGFLGFRRRDII